MSRASTRRILTYWLACFSVSGAPLVFPAPRAMQPVDEYLKLENTVAILLPLAPTTSDISLARFLTEELSDRFGVALSTKRVALLPRHSSFILLGSANNPLVRQYLKDRPGTPAHHEGYLLEAGRSSAVVAGTDDDGAFFGLQSLRQLITPTARGATIRGAKIRDWPLMPFRAVKLYLPGHEHIRYFKHFVRDVLALYKYNKLILEMNAAMRFDRHPELNAGWLDFAMNMKQTRRERSAGPENALQDSANSDTADGEVLEKAEVAELVRYVRSLHIDVIPEIPSLTHSYYLLTRHRELAEIPNAEWPDTYCPSEPRTYSLLSDVLDEYIEVMKPAMIHIGHDEWRMPLGICKRCRGKDPTVLFAADVNRIHGYLKSRGIATAMYGDHLIEALRGKKVRHNDNPGGAPYDMPGALSPEQVKKLIPKDILIFNWFWDGPANEDLNPQGIGRQNEANLSEWGFRQVFSNFSPDIKDFDRRIQRKGILGAVPTYWSAVTPLTIGKDVMVDVLGGANLLWSIDRPSLDNLTMTVEQLLPGIRNRLEAEPMNRASTPQRIAIEDFKAEQRIPVGEDASRLLFTHSCRKAGWNKPSFTATWNYADTAELLAQYEIEYADGSTTTIPVRYGVNVLEEDWARNRAPKSVSYEAKIVARPDGKSSFMYEWKNPRPGIPIRSVRLRSLSRNNPVTLWGLSIVPKRKTVEKK